MRRAGHQLDELDGARLTGENSNLEFGVLVDNPNLAESVERELRDAEGMVFERVQITSAPGR